MGYKSYSLGTLDREYIELEGIKPNLFLEINFGVVAPSYAWNILYPYLYMHLFGEYMGYKSYPLG